MAQLSRRRRIAGIVKDSAVLAFAGASGGFALLAQVAPTSPSSGLELGKLVAELGTSGALVYLVYLKNQQLVDLARNFSAQLENLNKLRMDESADFSARLDAIHRSGKAELQQLHQQAAAERAQLLAAALKPPKKGNVRKRESN